MQCPKCKSGDVMRAAVVWEQGTQVGSANTLGLGVGLGGGIGVGGAVTNTESRSLAAARLAPPVEPKVGGAFFVSLLLSLVWLFFGGAIFGGIASGSGQSWVTVFVPVGIVAIFWFFYSRRGKKVRQVAAEHAKRTDEWARTWYCARCGETGDEGEFAERVAA